MKYEEALSKIDFLNHRFRKMKQPWYKWAVDLDWDKIDKWCKMLGYKKEKNKNES